MKVIQLWNRERAAYALLLGCVLAFSPYAMWNVPDTGIIGLVKTGITFLALPGGVINIALARNVHGGALWIVDIANIFFYSGLTYYVLTIRARARTRT